MRQSSHRFTAISGAKLRRIPLFRSASVQPNPSGVDARPQHPTHGMAGREAYLREGEVFRRACEDVPPWSGWFWTRNAEGLTWLRHPGFPLELQSSLEQQEQQQQQRQQQQHKYQPGYEAHRPQQHQCSAQRTYDQSSANRDPEQLMGQALKENGTEAFLHDLEEPLLDDNGASSVSTSAGKHKTGLLVPEILFAEAYKVPVACFTVIGHDGTRKRLSSSELDTMQVPCPCQLPVSEVEHPHDPFATTFMVHACDTEMLMQIAQPKTSFSMVTWWSMVAPSMGLRLSPGCVAAALAAEKRIALGSVKT